MDPTGSFSQQSIFFCMGILWLFFICMDIMWGCLAMTGFALAPNFVL